MILRSSRLNLKKKGTIESVEIERELKLEPEDETELLQPYGPVLQWPHPTLYRHTAGLFAV